MGGSALTAVAFALSGGEPLDTRGVIAADPRADRQGRRLLVSVEPLEPSARGAEVAALALRVLRAAFADAAAEPATVALTRALTAANAVVRSENRPVAGCHWDRRVFVGATAIVIERRALTIAQAPASQALIVQDRQLYAFPTLSSWCCDYVPHENDGTSGDPLGYADDIRPALYRTVARRGDLIVLCSAAVARSMARTEPSTAARWLEPLHTGDLNGVLDALGQIVLAQELDHAHVLGVRLGRSSTLEVGTTVVGDALTRLGQGWSRPLRTRPAYASAGGGPPHARQPIPGAGAMMATASASGAPSTWASWRPAGRSAEGPVGPLAVLTAHLPSGLPDGVSIAPHVRRARVLGRCQLALVGATERMMAGSRRASPSLPWRAARLAAPGAGSVHCYRSARHVEMPSEWRARLPRGPLVRLPGRVIGVMLALLVALGTSGMAVARQHERSARADEYLSVVDQHVEAARAVTGPVAAQRLTLALEALGDAHRNGADPNTLTHRRATVTAGLDAVSGIDRFTEMVRLGSLPPALSGTSLRLVRGGSAIYLVGGGLYEVDSSGGRLVQLLAPGMTIDGGTVGPLVDGSWDTAGITVIDGTAVYARDDAGRWQRQPLGPSGAVSAGDIRACWIYQGSFFGLEPDEGRIIKFAAGQLDQLPDSWVDATAMPDLATARDLVIDGQVHVLLTDGRIVSLFQGVPRSTITPRVDPAPRAPVALDGGVETNFLYMAEPSIETGGSVGRILQIARDGTTRQLLPPVSQGGASSGDAAHALADLRDLAVDEAAGILYLVTGDAIWRATLPGNAPSSSPSEG